MSVINQNLILLRVEWFVSLSGNMPQLLQLKLMKIALTSEFTLLLFFNYFLYLLNDGHTQSVIALYCFKFIDTKSWNWLNCICNLR